MKSSRSGAQTDDPAPYGLLIRLFFGENYLVGIIKSSLLLYTLAKKGYIRYFSATEQYIRP